MIETIGSVRKSAAGYGRQQFYAERTQTLSIQKSIQIGLQDKVTLSPEAQVRAVQTSTTTTPPKTSSRRGEIAYEDPRRAIPYEKRHRSTPQAIPPEPAPTKTLTEEFSASFVQGLPAIGG